MRRILSLLFILFSFAGTAQQLQYLGAPNTTVLSRGPFGFALRDTTFTPAQRGVVVHRPADNALYVSVSNTARPYWMKLGSGAGFVADPQQCGEMQGGLVTHDSLLVYSVSPSAFYYINCRRYSSNGGKVTLAAAHATLPRRDKIAFDTLGNVVVFTGVPAADPVAIALDPAVYRDLAEVLVTAATTTDANAINALVFDENIGQPQEFNFSLSGVINASGNNTATSASKSKSIIVNSWGAGSSLVFTAAAEFSVVDLSTFTFFIRLPVALTDAQNISVRFRRGGSVASSAVVMPVNKTLLNQWQAVTVRLSDFTFFDMTIDVVDILFGGSNSNTVYFDYIRFQKGVQQVTTPAPSGNYVSHIYKNGDSVFYNIGGTSHFAYLSGAPLDTLPFSLTTTGTSGPATFDTATGILNIPQYSGGGGGGSSNWTKSGTTLYPNSRENILLGGSTETAATGRLHFSSTAGTDTIEVVSPYNFGTNYGAAGTMQRWSRGYTSYTGVNADGRPNDVFYEGYNAAPGGGRISTTDAGWQRRSETHYQINGVPHFELHWPEVYATDGNWYRTMSMYVSKTTGKAFIDHKGVEAHAWYTPGNLLWHSINHGANASSFALRDSSASNVGTNFYMQKVSATGTNEGLFSIINQNGVALISKAGLAATPSTAEIRLDAPNVMLAGATAGTRRVYINNDNPFVSGGTALFGATTPSTNSPAASAQVEVQSTTKGFLPPRGTSVQRTAISSPAKGLLFFDTDSNSLFQYTGAAWQNLRGGTSSGTVSQPNTQIVYGTGTGLSSSSTLTYASNRIRFNNVDYDFSATASGLDYMQYFARTGGVAAVYKPLNKPANNAYAFQFVNSSTSDNSSLLFVGENSVQKHIIAVDNGSSATKYPLVFRVGTSAWSSNAEVMTLLTSGNISMGTSSDIGRLGVVGGTTTSGGWTARFRNSAGSAILALRDDQYVGVKTESPNQALDVSGSFGAAITTITTGTTLGITHYTVLVDASAGPVSVSLPAASTGTERRIHVIKKIDASANAVTFSTAEGTQTLSTQWSGKTVQSSASAWYVIGNF